MQRVNGFHMLETDFLSNLTSQQTLPVARSIGTLINKSTEFSLQLSTSVWAVLSISSISLQRASVAIYG
jgi:hypothetical protein